MRRLNAGLDGRSSNENEENVASDKIMREGA